MWLAAIVSEPLGTSGLSYPLSWKPDLVLRGDLFRSGELLLDFNWLWGIKVTIGITCWLMFGDTDWPMSGLLANKPWGSCSGLPSWLLDTTLSPDKGLSRRGDSRLSLRVSPSCWENYEVFGRRGLETVSFAPTDLPRSGFDLFASIDVM